MPPASPPLPPDDGSPGTRPATLAEAQAALAEAQAGLEEARAALDRFVPPAFVRLLGAERAEAIAPGAHAECRATVLFADIRGFSTRSEAMTPDQTFAFVHAWAGLAAPIVEVHGGYLDEVLGDGVLAVFPGRADDALAAALDLLARLPAFPGIGPDEPRVEVGIGVHTGWMTVGALGGPNRLHPAVVGDAVNVCARIESLTRDYGTPLLLSDQALFDLEDPAAHDLRFLDRLLVRGRIHPQSIYEVFEADPPDLRQAKRATRQRFEEALSCWHSGDPARARPLLEQCLEAVPGDGSARIYLERCRKDDWTCTAAEVPSVGWKDAWLLGEPEIDAQHREIVRRIAALSEQVRRGGGSALASMFDYLADYARDHFTLERRLMERCAYPHTTAHLREHALFTRRFGTLRHEFETGGLDPCLLGFRLQVFLVDWLVHHIAGTDRRLADFPCVREGP
ncbi:MAG: bacteriohemerythrin [Deltaproteobacteria bacterium]|nr:bacteriohemerythrin [Deltaproteobacteria bacterium]